MARNPYRCPICNGLGSKDLPQNICRRCDIDRFKDTLLALSNNSPKTIQSALLEVKAKKPEDVSHADRVIVTNTIKRRTKVQRTKGHLAGKHRPFEKYGHDFYNEPTDIGIIKEKPDIERSME